jgi:hypothetical protein
LIILAKLSGVFWGIVISSSSLVACGPLPGKPGGGHNPHDSGMSTDATASDAPGESAPPDAGADSSNESDAAATDAEVSSIPTCTSSTGVSEPITAPCVWKALSPCLPEIAQCSTQTVTQGSLSAHVTCDPASGWWSSSSDYGIIIQKDNRSCFTEEYHFVTFGPFAHDIFDSTGTKVATIRIDSPTSPFLITCYDTGQVYTLNNRCSFPQDRCATKTDGVCPIQL